MATNILVEVFDGNVEHALRRLKKVVVTGLYKDMKRHAFYEKPSVKRKRKSVEARRKGEAEGGRMGGQVRKRG